MNDLFNKSEDKPKDIESAIQVKPEKLTAKKGHLKRTVITAALLFLVPFCLAVLFAIFAKRVSTVHIQQREVNQAKQAADSKAPLCAEDAGVAELLEHHNHLRERGDALEPVNIRLWAAAGREPTLLFEIPPPGSGEWSWSVAQCGGYALAIDTADQEALIRDVALYSFMDADWIWRKKLPWPENYEAPWVFNGHLILRSSKNNRCFAMELDKTGTIIALDSLASGSSFSKKPLEIPNEIPGEPIAMHFNVIFVSGAENSALKAYAKCNLPGLFSIGALPANACVSGNGLLKFTVNDGAIFATDAFTDKKLATYKGWAPSTNTVVKGVESNRDGSNVTVHLTSVFHYEERLERNWCLAWNPADETAQTNMTNAPSFTPADQNREVVSTNLNITLALHGNNMLKIRERTGNTSVSVDLSQHIPCGDDPIQSLELLEDERFLLIKQDEQAHLLDLFSVMHYAELLNKIAHINALTAKYSEEELNRTNIASNAMREVKSQEQSYDSADNFNYTMEDYPTYLMRPQDLEPPAIPSILSLQAEFYATHQAWLYAADKLERLLLIQEHDHRAPTANPLLYTRYALLSGNKERAREGREKSLRSVFYDNTSYNRMIRWQAIRMMSGSAQ